jgi:Fic family protein
VALAAPERWRHQPTEQLASRIAAEFQEMPGMSLTLPQASRLFDLPRDQCRRVLEELLRRGVIQATPQGLYRRTEAE